VQIYEPILKDQAGHVTTGSLSAVGYLKDNASASGSKNRPAEKEIGPHRATRMTMPISPMQET